MEQIENRKMMDLTSILLIATVNILCCLILHFSKEAPPTDSNQTGESNQAEIAQNGPELNEGRKVKITCGLISTMEVQSTKRTIQKAESVSEPHILNDHF